MTFQAFMNLSEKVCGMDRAVEFSGIEYYKLLLDDEADLSSKNYP